MFSHEAYTNSKFKEAQEEVHGLLHTNANKFKTDGSTIVYEVVERIVKPIWKVKRNNFIINLDKTLGDFNFFCKLFEFKGILCKHII